MLSTFISISLYEDSIASHEVKLRSTILKKAKFKPYFVPYQCKEIIPHAPKEGVC